MQLSMNFELIGTIANVVIASLPIIISLAAFWVALLTYRSGKKPVISLKLSVREDWIILDIMNTGKGEAGQLNIEYDFCGKSSSKKIQHLPPGVIYSLKLEPFSIFQEVPISKREIVFNYRYIDCYKKENRRTGIVLQVIH